MSEKKKVKFRMHCNDMKKVLLVFIFVLLVSDLLAQDFHVRSFEYVQNDLSARMYERVDINGEPCALIKVALPIDGAIFSGNTVEPIERKGGEYWVYMTKGSKLLKIKHPTYHPLDLSFNQLNPNINSLEEKATYVLTIDVPVVGVELPKNYLIISVSPADATVMIDNKLIENDGSGKIRAKLAVGNHNYRVMSVGYKDEAGQIEMGNAEKNLSVSLKQAYGSLDVDYTPVDAEVYLDGKKLGTTPKKYSDIAVGSHSVEIRKSGYENTKLPVTIEEGKTELIEGSLKATNVEKKDGEKEQKTVQAKEQLALVDKYYKEYNYKKALSCLKKAANYGYAEAQYELGLVYQIRHAMPSTTRRNKQLLKLYDLGKLVEDNADNDYKKAVKWYRLAADQGHSMAQYMLSHMYEWGNGVEKDSKEAIKWLNLAANQELPVAQYMLGIWHDPHFSNNIEGIEKDYKEAAKWYRLAANQGYPEAQCQLGRFYQGGNGVEKDYKEAVKWYKLAANQGLPEAQYKLGILYEKGYGVEKNLDEALRLYKLAHKWGYAGDEYRSLKKRLGYKE